ncbi:MAG TPA: 50S ribosomal protein L1 [Candidatus Nanoarchaeia archaeon]|nr:50S ribosomal protein L1 [Candidatus Nanoarchaeia archaeon]
MDKKEILEAVKLLRNPIFKKKFPQTFDIVINLRGLDLKKDSDKISVFQILPFGRGKKISIGAFVDQALLTSAKATCDVVVTKEDFAKYKKKEAKNLASQCDFFIAQASLMPQIAATFGRYFGPRGKMPNPKAGCVVPPTMDLKTTVDRLQKTVKLETKNESVVRAPIGIETMKDEEIAENAMAIYNTIIHALPQEKNNLKSILLKLTMSPSVNLDKISEFKAEKPVKVKKEKKIKEAKEESKAEPEVSPKKSKEKKVKEDGKELQAKSA